MSDERPEIDFKDLLNQREKEGRPLVVIEPSSTSKSVIETLKKLLPEDKQNAVVLVDLGKNTQ